MLHYLYASDLIHYPRLREGMFRDRGRQFKTRLGWDVRVDETGAEQDGYDAANPLYILWSGPDGCHGGSMRVLPTNGDCMVNDHFSDISGGPLRDRLIWESTRFCLSPDLDSATGAQVSAALMLAGCELGLRFGLRRGVGVFDARMIRIYRRLGWPPEVLGSAGKGRAKIYAGLWSFSPALRRQLANRAGISESLSEYWFQSGFNALCAPEQCHAA